MLEIIIVSVLVMLVSLSGAITVSKKASLFVEKNLGILTSFAAGVFGVVTFLLLQETVLHAGMSVALLWAALGALLVVVISYLIPEAHHHHGQDSSHTHLKGGATRILVSDGVHNIADGILITASFLASGVVGIGVAVSILVHEIVQEVTEFFVLKQAGFSTRQALGWNFAVSSTILVGAIGSFYFLQVFSGLEPILLGISAGGFLAVLAQDLLPTSFSSAKTGRRASHLLAFGLGIVLMLGAGLVFGHSHEHGHQHSHDHHREHGHQHKATGQTVEHHHNE